MSKFDKSMSEIFNISPFTDPMDDGGEPKQVLVPIQETPKTNDLKVDLSSAYNQSKDNLEDIISQGMEAMEDILAIAKEGQHPRAFEVYGSLLKNVVDANKELLNIQKQMREMDTAGQKSGPTNIEKAVFVGTPSDLNKLLKGKSLDEDDIQG
jgi:hypothetical protein